MTNALTHRPARYTTEFISPTVNTFSRITRSRSSGMTLVELLVAMAVGLLVVAATVAVLSVAQRGFTTVDAASQLRDNGRYATDLITRIVLQTGFEDVSYSTTPRKNDAMLDPNPAPNITGFNNAQISPSDPFNATSGVWGGAAAGHGSDILILRYQGGETYPGSGKADGSMITCTGNSPTAIPANRDERIASIFYVAISNGEPTLMCKSSSDGTTPPSGGGQPIITGVESFQVLYGVDGVTANTATPTTAAAPNKTDRYLRADQMVVGTNDVATYNNWRRVRSIRIGMVLVGAPHSVQDSQNVTVFPFGNASSSSGGAAGSAFASAADAGTTYSVGSDGRLRQTVTFTVHLRNYQDIAS
jgi:type IV pilus assembly protein PilW